ncbi:MULTISPECIES: hypothetical protein [Streptomyces]|uniref:Uncharacterized protein n=2 Tax=Streptomyces TaxID=1883 RepID=A0A100Y225_9ACTN|nr:MULTISPECIES: hypothetical protein [Streptomyces]KUH36195.1 hypothetical protein ATE80_24885 [Streptomyces kanasensis]UUS33591.1 hypothetical protein NRO40_24035 [Streptomyces changanensis]
MRRPSKSAVPQLGTCLLLALLATAVWAAWLGWDQHPDVQPDGSTTGPYEAWQVIGLVLTLLVPVSWAAYRRHLVGAVLGPTAGLTAAAFHDWSDDSSGLFVIGVGLVMVGSLAATSAVTAVVAAVTRDSRPASRAPGA